MTTYPLSEPATIYRADGSDDATDVVAQGTLSECADILKAWTDAERETVRVDMDDLSLCYGPQEMAELLKFLRAEHDEAQLPVGLVDRP